ncbi:MAG: MiaB/RimO family radical SAM methylthiotransferase, partial [Gemmatimonadota bacterium]
GVTGCMAQRIGDRLVDEIDGVDLVAGPDAYRDIGERIDQIRFGGLERGQRLLELDGSERYEGMEAVREEGVTAWITVQRGCDHRCTFCIVPYVRGGEKNRDPSAVLHEVREVVERGYTEITLLGQTVNSYQYEETDFADLLESIVDLGGLDRIRFTSPYPVDFTPKLIDTIARHDEICNYVHLPVRFTSPHPNDVTERLVEVMAEEEAVCRQLHLPAQSGSDWMLKRMVRRYTVDEYLEKVRMLRDAIPDIALSTDMIVGFPGEREVDFQATLDLMREVRYDDAFLEELISLHREIQRDVAEGEVDREVEVLVEEPAKSDGDMLGRTERNKAVVFPGDEGLIGEYVDVRLHGTTGATFRGERVT